MRRRVAITKRRGRWWWECDLCDPPSHGSTVSFEKTVSNVARHCRRLRQHHDYVKRNKP